MLSGFEQAEIIYAMLKERIPNYISSTLIHMNGFSRIDLDINIEDTLSFFVTGNMIHQFLYQEMVNIYDPELINKIARIINRHLTFMDVTRK
jgi:hypothetical protein